MKNWIIIVVVVTVIIVGSLFIFKDKFIHFVPPLVQSTNKCDKKIMEFLIDPGARKIKDIEISKESFEELKIDPGYVLYYFNGECPTYHEDILLVEETKHGNRYYLPETNSIIKIPVKHSWTKEWPEINNFLLSSKKDGENRSIQEPNEFPDE